MPDRNLGFRSLGEEGNYGTSLYYGHMYVCRQVCKDIHRDKYAYVNIHNYMTN